MLNIIASVAPFEFNDLLGPLLALSLFAGALKVLFAMGVLRHHLEKEESTYRTSHLPKHD